MQQALIDLFTAGDAFQKWAFWIILGITFLLGMLVWFVLMHYPALRKLRKKNKKQQEEIDDLKITNQNYTERNTVLTAKLKRTEENLTVATANLKEKNTKLIALVAQLKKTTEERDLYQNQARSYKENYEGLMTNYRDISAQHKELGSQLVELKNNNNKLEEENRKLKNLVEVATLEQQEAELLMVKLKEEEEKNKESIIFLQQDLEEALVQKAELKKMAFETKLANNLEGLGEEELKQKLVVLQSHAQDLEQENKELLQKLLPYIKIEEEKQKEEDKLLEMMAIALADVEHNMANDGFYVDYPEKDLIADKAYLEKTLAEEAAQELVLEEETEEEEILLTEEDTLAIQDAELMAKEAMSLQGFYQEIDAAVLLQKEDEKEWTEEEEDKLLEVKLEEVAEALEQNPLYQETIDASLLIENQALLDQKMKEEEDNPILPSEEIEEEEIILEDQDHQDMDKALEEAAEMMEIGGLYAPISPEKLMTSATMVISRTEQMVMDEIGHSIPKAANHKDDLKKIDGIGMFLEEKLNYFGIQTFEQIVAFDDSFIAKLTTAIGFSENTIYRDKWIEQAQKLSLSN